MVLILPGSKANGGNARFSEDPAHISTSETQPKEASERLTLLHMVTSI